MAVNEQIVTGRKFRKLIDEATKLWQRISFWTKSSDVEFDDGENAETKVGAIKGITKDLNTTEEGYAADMTALAKINSKFAPYTERVVLLNYYGLNTGVFQLSDSIKNYRKIIIDAHLSGISDSAQHIFTPEEIIFLTSGEGGLRKLTFSISYGDGYFLSFCFIVNDGDCTSLRIEYNKNAGGYNNVVYVEGIR